MPYYTIQQGDTLSKVAERCRLASWQAIYNHESNAAFRKLRPNHNLLHPGDVVFVPEIEIGGEFRETDRRHTFVLLQQKQFLRLMVEDIDGRPLTSRPYEIVIDHKRSHGKTDSRGTVEVEIPVDAVRGTLKVDDCLWHLQIGNLNPLLEDAPDNGVSGAQGRLLNLGYPTGPVDGIPGPQTVQAIRLFQADCGLPPTGQLDPATRRKLVEVHGI